MGMTALSVVIITFNEERNIARCINSVKDIADEIVVVDSYSTDNTKNICSNFDVIFIQRKWEGFSAAKNFANSMSKNDWILSLDADEVLSDQLRETIKNLKFKNEFSYCSFNRLTNYCGSWIRHSNWYPDKKLRLFNRKNSEWSGLIHEELSVPVNIIIKHFKIGRAHV